MTGEPNATYSSRDSYPIGAALGSSTALAQNSNGNAGVNSRGANAGYNGGAAGFNGGARRANGGAGTNANNNNGNGGTRNGGTNGALAEGALVIVSPSGVRQVQQALNRLGYFAGQVNGT